MLNENKLFSEIPECGDLYALQHTIKEGDSVQLVFVPKRFEATVKWLDNTGKNIQIGNGKFAQSQYKNNKYVLTINNIQLKQDGLYRVQCSSGTTTEGVNVTVIGTYV